MSVATLSAAVWFVDRVDETRAWVQAVEIERPGAVAGRLLDAAVAAGVLRFDPAEGRLAVTACEARLDPSLGTAGGAPLDHAGRDALDALCTRDVGRLLLSEISAWNASFDLLAIRDNRGGPACDDGRTTGPGVMAAGCKTAAWAAEVASLAGGWRPVSLDPGAAPPARDFVSLALDAPPGASDWAVLPSRRDAIGSTVRLTASLPAGQTVTVDLIGAPIGLTGGGATASLHERASNSRFAVGGIEGRIVHLCKGIRHDPDCRAAAGRNAARAVRLALTVPPGPVASLAIEATAIRNRPGSLARVSAGEPGATAVVTRTPHLRLSCRSEAGTPQCVPEWIKPSTRDRIVRHRYGIRLADGRDLVDPEGRILPEALDLGLAPVVGWGPEDVGSLTAALAGRPLAEDGIVTLTVDPKAQAAAVAVLAEAMAERRAKGMAGPDTKAGIVLLDADAAPGSILALAGSPGLSGGPNAWDLAALAVAGDRVNPLAGHLWRAGDVDTMPGSTFKLLTALAGLEAAATGDEGLWSLWSGALAVPAAARRLGLATADAAELVVPGAAGERSFAVRNAGRQAFGRDALPPGRSGCPAVASAGTRQLGVCEALIRSSNIWFAGLALALDGSTMLEAQGRERTDATANLALARVLDRLFPVYRRGGGLDLTRGAVPGAFRLVAEPVRLSATEPAGARRIAVATNGYGQGVTMSPLAVASVYVSLATGRVVLPRLVAARSPGSSADPREGRPLFAAGADDRRLEIGLALIRAGLHGVANSPDRSMMPPTGDPAIDRRIYSKTGTATTRREGINSAWYAGWLEPWPGVAGDRRIAFACWVTQSPQSGGSTCGPIIGRLLKRLDAEGRE